MPPAGSRWSRRWRRGQDGEGDGEGGGQFEAASETLAAALVQDRLKAAAEEAGATLSSVQVLPFGEDGALRRVALRVQLDASLPVVQRMLHTLEGARPYLVLDNLSLRVVARTAAKEAEPVLAVQFDALGYARIARP